MIESISLILSVASSLVTILTFTKHVNDDKTQNAINFLNDIASTIEDAIVKFKNNEIPHGSCEKMRLYAKDFPVVLDGMVGENYLQEYSDRLYHAHDIENWLISVRENKNALIELEKAVGYFRASANLIKIK